MHKFDANILLDCYRRGVFPMAESRNDNSIFLVDPDKRGIIPLDGLHISRSMRKQLRRGEYRISYDGCYDRVVAECARETLDRPDTWINGGIAFLYSQLHKMGHAHSVEVWKGEELVGGLYGVSIGGAFFGESMFSRATNASKVALVYLVGRLNRQGYK
ncbi:MAG: leucyl/phenylalanyl-tRNA--protein transferase, partial [Hellea sp.]|nr:leucyl/phenylalanyl-tRNA--protein transferase [Hellea sp.]